MCDVIATLEGTLAPAEVFIAIGHLDDRPDPGPAPGANDNGSGSAMLLSLAEVMSRYRVESSIKFLSVTGEEQGSARLTYNRVCNLLGRRGLFHGLSMRAERLRA